MIQMRSAFNTIFQEFIYALKYVEPVRILSDIYVSSLLFKWTVS